MPPSLVISMPPLDNNDAWRKDELVFNLITKQYDDQSQRRRDLDSKAGGLIGYVTIVTGLLIGLGTFSILGSLSKPQFYLPYFIGIASLIASIVFSLLAIRIRKWTAVPAVRKLFDAAMKDPNFTDRTIFRRVGLDMVDAVEQNHQYNEQKAKWTLISWYFLIAGLVLIVIYAAIFTASGNLKEAQTQITTTTNNATLKKFVSELSQSLSNQTLAR